MTIEDLQNIVDTNNNVIFEVTFAPYIARMWNKYSSGPDDIGGRSWFITKESSRAYYLELCSTIEEDDLIEIVALNFSHEPLTCKKNVITKEKEMEIRRIYNSF